MDPRMEWFREQVCSQLYMRPDDFDIHVAPEEAKILSFLEEDPRGASMVFYTTLSAKQREKKVWVGSSPPPPQCGKWVIMSSFKSNEILCRITKKMRWMNTLLGRGRSVFHQRTYIFIAWSSQKFEVEKKSILSS